MKHSKQRRNVFKNIILAVLLLIMIVSGCIIIKWARENKHSILTLSTCANNNKYRVVLHAKRIN